MVALKDTLSSDFISPNSFIAVSSMMPRKWSLSSFQPSFMDTNEQSHFYANDQTLRSLHSQSLAEVDQSSSESSRVYTRLVPAPLPPTSVSTKRKEPTSSPPHLPVAKRTPLSPSKSVRKSIVDICLRPSRLLRSRGPAPDVPNIPFPVESRAYRRVQERLEAQDEAEPSSSQDVAGPEDVPRP